MFLQHKLGRAVADLEQARLAAHRQRAAADDLHPRVLLRVVRGGDADAAVEPELADGEVDHLGADQPEVEHVGARVGGAVDQRGGHRRRGEAHVAPDGDPPRLEVLDVGAADRVRALLVELVGVDAADVVGLEDLRVEHGSMLWDGRGAARRRPAGDPSQLQSEGGTQARNRPLRRPRRLDRARLDARSGGRAPPRHVVLRARLALHHDARRHRREVRRRRRDGRVRHPAGARGRRRARRPRGGARSWTRCTGSRSRRASASSPARSSRTSRSRRSRPARR